MIIRLLTSPRQKASHGNCETDNDSVFSLHGFGGEVKNKGGGDPFGASASRVISYFERRARFSRLDPVGKCTGPMIIILHILKIILYDLAPLARIRSKPCKRAVQYIFVLLSFVIFELN